MMGNFPISQASRGRAKGKPLKYTCSGDNYSTKDASRERKIENNSSPMAMGKNEPREGLSPPFILRVTWAWSVASIIVAHVYFNSSILYHDVVCFESVEKPCVGILCTYNFLLTLGLSASCPLPLVSIFSYTFDDTSSRPPFPQILIHHLCRLIVPCLVMIGV